ncbi:rhamnan synthesis F family protein [Cryobacterium breve]|uniref:rhamnan synthesis F family protein n=1 Tax=Cryobacterium breve TaxID=1259258 RepID=UPI00248B8B50|nr:rhamnan synthesis F family protein [Cryobacterium breve]
MWGATNTTQFFAHIQSFFVGYRSGILSDPALRQFWSELEIETDKRMIIQRYELGLSQLLFAEGLTTSACFESERTVMAGQNPTMHGWKNLIQCGFPFVKREAPDQSGGRTGWQHCPGRRSKPLRGRPQRLAVGAKRLRNLIYEITHCVRIQTNRQQNVRPVIQNRR